MPCRFSNDIFALKKLSIVHIENLQAIKKFGYQAYNELGADKLTVNCIHF